MVLVMLYIPTQIGREEKNNVSFIFVSFGPYLTLDVCEGFLLAKTEEQWSDLEKAEFYHHKTIYFPVSKYSTPTSKKTWNKIVLYYCFTDYF